MGPIDATPTQRKLSWYWIAAGLGGLFAVFLLFRTSDVPREVGACNDPSTQRAITKNTYEKLLPTFASFPFGPPGMIAAKDMPAYNNLISVFQKIDYQFLNVREIRYDAKANARICAGEIKGFFQRMTADEQRQVGDILSGSQSVGPLLVGQFVARSEKACLEGPVFYRLYRVENGEQRVSWSCVTLAAGPYGFSHNNPSLQAVGP